MLGEDFTKQQMREAFSIINPDCSEEMLESYLVKVDEEFNKYGSDAIYENKIAILNMLKEYTDFVMHCEDTIIAFESGIKYKTIWAQTLNKAKNDVEAFSQYQEVVKVYSDGITDMLESLAQKTPKILAQIDSVTEILKHDEKLAKNTYLRMKKDEKLATRYIESLKAMSTGENLENFEDAVNDAYNFYNNLREKRIACENLRKNLPKIGKLKSRFNKVITEHNSFVSQMNSVEKTIEPK